MGVRAFRASRTITWTAGVIVALAMVGFILRLVDRVRTGRGLEPYITARGYETNAVQVLTTIGLLTLVFVVYAAVTVVRKRRS